MNYSNIDDFAARPGIGRARLLPSRCWIVFPSGSRLGASLALPIRAVLTCTIVFLFAVFLLNFSPAKAEEVGSRWGTEEREREFYPIVNIPIPQNLVIEAGAFCVLPDGRVAVGTRHGEIYIMNGIDKKRPIPSYHLYATGLDEIFGLAYKDGAFYVTQSCELTKVSRHEKERQGRSLRNHLGCLGLCQLSRIRFWLEVRR